MKKYGLLYSMLALLMVLVPSCITDDDLGQTCTVGTGEDLIIKLETPALLTRATEAGDDDLNENTINNAQLLIFNADGNRTPEGYRTFEFSEGVQLQGVIASGNWKENAQLFDQGADAAYDIYVVANNHGGKESLQSVQTVDQLLDAVDEDADIWKFEGAETSTQKYQNKSFAMSGLSQGFVPSAQENECVLTVSLERMAAKVEVNITFNDDFKQKFQPTGFYSSLRNYATRALLRSDKEDAFNDRGLAGNLADDPMVVALKSDYEACTAQLLLYTYPTNWGNDVLKETFVLLNMPGNYTEGDQTEFKGSNYYKIPVRLGDASAHKVNRNTIYRVNVTIDRLGQPQIDVPVELKPQYEVMPWSVVDINVDNGNLNYLELLEDEVIMKNIATTDEQYFTSSSPVTVRVTEAYYYDKYGQKQTIASNQYSRYGIEMTPDPANSGTLQIASDVPTNNGIRYIKVEVTNEQGLSKTFTVKQYPLEYIVTVPGWYSYRDDFNSTYERMGNRITWNDQFQSKVYTGNSIYEYAWYTRGYFGWSRPSNEVHLGAEQSSNPNNNMYFVRITKTSDEYVLSVPAMDADGYTERSAENNQLVAPAFMIASQLGTVYPSGFNDAKEHCKQYAEKSIAGEVYDDWRLPTEAELEIIDRFQNTDGSVIDRVLGGAYYWAASGEAYETQEGTQGSSTSAYIRCIRTVKANEPIVEDKE